MFEPIDNLEGNYASNPPPKENRARGISKRNHTLKNKTKGIIQKVTYNARSQPIGREAINYSTYLVGSLAWNGWVPITCPDWHHAYPLRLNMI